MTTLSDTFNRVDSSSLGADWTEVEGDLRIVSEHLINVNANERSYARHTSDLATSNHYAQITLSYLETPTGNTAIAEACVRGNSSDLARYVGRITNNTTGGKTYELASRSSSGTLASITSTAGTIASTDAFACYIVGDQLSLKKNGVTVLGPVTTTVITSGLRAGITKTCGTSATYDFEINSWIAEDVAASTGSALLIRLMTEGLTV